MALNQPLQLLAVLMPYLKPTQEGVMGNKHLTVVGRFIKREGGNRREMWRHIESVSAEGIAGAQISFCSTLVTP